MSASVQESKPPGSIYLINENPKFTLGPYHAVLHLFEHEYKPGMRFWYGIADLACTEEELLTDVKSRGFDARDATFVHKVVFQVNLDDGRNGDGRVTHWAWTFGTEGTHMEIAFVGTSALDIPFVPPPDQS